MRTDGRVVVITGAAQGIGAAMARRLSVRGWRVALLDRDADLLAQTTAACGPHAASETVDVTDAAGLESAAEQVVARFGRVDAVVANAGIGAGGALLGQDPEAYERVIEVNLLGSVRTVRAFPPALVDSRGYLLQVASLAAMTPAPLMSAYCASKAGVEAFAHSLRGELAHRGVDVGVAYLAFTDTSMVRQADEEPGLRLARASMPPPFGATSPLAPAVDRLVRGVEARRAHVYGQGWLRLLPALRGALPALTARSAGRIVPRAEALLHPTAQGGRREPR